MKKTLALSAALAALLATSGMASAADVFPYVKSTTGQNRDEQLRPLLAYRLLDACSCRRHRMRR